MQLKCGPVLTFVLLCVVQVVICEPRLERTLLHNVVEISMQINSGKLNISQECLAETRHYLAHLQNLTLWAFEMWDATAKQSSGILGGSIFQMGNYDQCMKATEGAPPRQYCLTEVHLIPSEDVQGAALKKIFDASDPSVLRRDRLRWAVCVPAACTRQDLAYALSSLASRASARIEVPEGACQMAPQFGKPAMEVPVGAMVFYWMFGIILVLILLSTLWHYRMITSEKEKKFSPMVNMYSLLHTLPQLAKFENSSGLDVLHGMRFFSICFIIIDHRIGTTISGPISNRERMEELYRLFESVFVCHGDLLVDTFLVLSGLLSMFTLLKKFKDSPMNFPMILFFRYMRLIPMYAAAIFFTACVLPLTGSGPLWPVIIGPEGEYCRENWWTNLLMISNYVNKDKMCMVQSWYIPCDFHFFILSLLACYILKVRGRAAVGLCAVAFAILASVIVPALITFFNRLPATLLFYNDFLTNPRGHEVFRQIYIPSHSRATPYLLGLLTGYLIHKYQLEKKFSRTVSSTGAAVSLLIMLATLASGFVFYETSRPYSAVEAALYAGLHRPAWAAAICLLVMCCVYGTVPFISVFLGWRPWAVLGKLVYGAYLMHMSFQMRSVALTRQPFFLDPFSIACVSLGDIFISFAAALVLYLVIEAPVKEMLFMAYQGFKRKSGKSEVPQGTYNTTQLHHQYTNKGADLNELGLDIKSQFVKNNNCINDNTQLEKSIS